MKPCSKSCDQNKALILAVIQPLFKDCRSVLEIGNGTGQHAVCFAENMPHLIWYTSESNAGISLLDDYAIPANNHILCWQKSAD